jgi:hypothetical protein
MAWSGVNVGSGVIIFAAKFTTLGNVMEMLDSFSRVPPGT